MHEYNICIISFHLFIDSGQPRWKQLLLPLIIEVLTYTRPAIPYIGALTVMYNFWHTFDMYLNRLGKCTYWVQKTEKK